MAAMMFGPMELMFVLLFGGGMGLPLGMPPGPEDPVLSRVAPEECLFYMNWAGMASPDPKSANHTERLLAEPEVRRFVSELDQRIVESLRRETRNDPQAEAAIDEVHKVVIAVLTSPTAAYVSKVDFADGVPDFRAGALVNLGDRADEVKQALAKLEAIALGPEAKPAGEGPWRTLPLPGGPAVQWAVKNKYLIVGVGEGEADALYARARRDPPAWLADARKRLPVERTASVTYLNVAGLVKLAGPQMGREGAAVLDALGLSKVQYVASVTGLEGDGCATRTLLAIDGQPTGILSVLAARPLAPADLAPIPADATLAVAARFDLAKAFGQLLDTAGRIDPRAREEIAGGLGMIEEKLGFSIAKDVFEAVGDRWCVYNSPGEGGLVATGLTAVVDLRDRDKLIRANAKLVLSVMAGGAARGVTGEARFNRDPRILQFKHGEHTVFFLAVPDGVPFAPAWCITEKHLVVALYPQNVKAFLSRPAGAKSLADSPAAAGLFAGGAPMAACYSDTPELFKMVYPIVNMVATVLCGELQRQGMDVDVSLLPSAAAVLPHVRPSTSRLAWTDAGVVLESRYTLPVGGGVMMVPMLPWLFFARASSPMMDLGDLPTPQNTSINNLKQIGLAMHNCHDAWKAFPPTGAPREPGQPPVSWRVVVLPYIEQMELYKQYRFDEPWDGENNKKLLDKMPAVYKAPGSKVAAKGMTNYLAVVGDEYAFARDKRNSIMQFRDGTSNTIMVVEASDEKAVPWTKPEDFTPGKKDPAAGLVGLRAGGFLAVLADGSVHLISKDLDAETLRALFTKSGGEVVDWSWRDGRRGRPMPPRRVAVEKLPEPEFEEAPEKP